MSLLAVLDSAQKEQQTEFEVAELHVNLWSLAAFGGRRRSFVLDVGVRVRATNEAVSRISLAIPFGTGEFECLHAKVTQPRTAELLFNTDVSVTQSEITLEGEPLQIHEVSKVDSNISAPHSSNDFSLWDLTLTRPIPANQIGYFRVRFPVTGLGKTWQWQRQRLFRSGATIDIRVSDGRSATLIPDGNRLMERVRPIDRISAFVMVPAWMHGRTISPSPHYIRLLEGRVWKDYLDRSPEWRTRSRLIVYYWKNAKRSGDGATHQAISPDKPFQIFSDFGIDSHPSRLTTIVASALLSVLGFGAIYAMPVRGWVTDTVNWITSSWNDYFSAWSFSNPINTVVIVVAAIFGLVRLTRSSAKFATWLRTAYLKSEAKIFRMLSSR